MVGRHIIFEEDKEVLIALDAIRICMELLRGVLLLWNLGTSMFYTSKH